MSYGKLIAFEGIDGTGKSTQIRMLADCLSGRGFDVVTTREPTDGPCGRKIRSLFASRDQLTPEEELALFMDDRREHVRELILPALKRGAVVLTDRYYFSTAAYQGAAGHDPQAILAANEAFAPVPDLVIILDLSPEESVRRIRDLRGEALNDFEQQESLQAVAEVFAGFGMDYIKHVDASGPQEVVAGQVAQLALELFNDNSLLSGPLPEAAGA
ncbi:MAG: dTMP kinase [Proteobacteria bacterium]|nr:dTMP kinase [Pseudomonadota bacterium]MBU1737360.1 dTMP kinase [Pseudomonadota bacterium]